jgi:hypothetical protein
MLEKMCLHMYKKKQIESEMRTPNPSKISYSATLLVRRMVLLLLLFIYLTLRRRNCSVFNYDEDCTVVLPNSET